MTINYRGDAVRAITTLGLAGVDITEWPVSVDEVAAIKSNIGYNTALASGIFALGQLNLVDGIVNPFSNENEIDLPASSGQVYDATGDFYKNGVGSPKATWSKTVDSSVGGAAGFSMRNVVNAINLTSDGAFVRVTLSAPATGEGLKIDNVSIGERSGATADTVAAPVSLLFGGNAGTGTIAAGSTLTSDWLEFAIDSAKDYLVIFDVSNDTANDMLGLATSGDGYYERSSFNGYNVSSGSGYTLVNSGQSLGLSGFEVADADANVTVQSKAVTADAVPGEALLSFLLTPGDVLTPDTDIKGYVSRDGGNTWTQATLAATLAGFPWQNLLTGGVDLSGQPSGTSMKWKLVSANHKEFYFENVSLFWD
ncbi:MAG: hypothetical protein G3M70_06045 [Candidatus Nitronauta litoralis]|uniref:Uncharacterized protein n=1 Tax=Candidatus Nitronauta litoralis TaxID=2705533 RepID=A0A7T0G051_9BACT|nr:MAG: hypothetical protein G3M70_06045 [Candidatus Nitronauta litoralis]